MFAKQTKKGARASLTYNGWARKRLAMEQLLPVELISKLQELGQALDIKQSVSVFDGGRVELNVVGENKEIEYGQRQAAGRSPAESRRRAWRQRRTSGGSRPSSEAPPFCSDQAETLYGADRLNLVLQYSARIFEDEAGIWVACKSRPLGARGPLFHLLVAVPFEQRVMPRAWAFRSIGPHAKPVGPRHTNFGDASICAFAKENCAWDYPEGLVRLIDLYSVWLLKHLWMSQFGRWPGPQSGAVALYRRQEFKPQEWCGCNSGLRYGECHHQADQRLPDALALIEFGQAFQFHYENRNVPPLVLDAARTKWARLPTIRQAYSSRPADPVRLSSSEVSEIPSTQS